MFSSPNVAELQGNPAVVVGDRAGNVLAYNLANGSIVPGWPFRDGGISIDSSPSVAPGGGTVYVGLGTSINPNEGEYVALGQNGSPVWQTTAYNPSTDLASRSSGVTASMSVGVLQGQTAVTSGSLGQSQYTLNAATGGVLPGWDPWVSGDSEVSTPAIADLYGSGQNEVIEGIGTTAGNLYGQQYSQGGHIRVILQTGNAGQQYPNGGLVCQFTTDEAVSSSPAVGRFLGGGGIGIVSGTSDYYGNGAYTDSVVALSPRNGGDCAQAWSDRLDGSTSSGPAVADVLGNGSLQVVEGTWSPNTMAGTVYVMNGANGSIAWSRPLAGGDLGSIATADLSGGGYQDLLVPTIAGVQVFDGRSGNLIATLGGNAGFQSTPLITNDPNGTIGITIAGYSYASDTGVVDHYEVDGHGHANADELGAWPQFHHDPQLTGNASGDTQIIPTPPPPAGVGLAATADGKGYWLVASDGGIFAYGDARFYGSAGGIHLNGPSSGWPPPRTGRATGWWRPTGASSPTATPGSRGSAGDIQLNQPIVGMARPRREGLLAGGVRRRHLLLRRRPVLRVDGSPPAQPPIVGMAAGPEGAATGWWPPTAASSPSATRRSRARRANSCSTGPSSGWPRPRRERLLAGGGRRRHLRLRRRALLGLDRQHPAERAHRGDGGHAAGGGLLAGGRRRWHLQLRRRRLLRITGRRGSLNAGGPGPPRPVPTPFAHHGVHGHLDGLVVQLVPEVVRLGVLGDRRLSESHPLEHGDHRPRIDGPPVGDLVCRPAGRTA